MKMKIFEMKCKIKTQKVISFSIKKINGSLFGFDV
jgi:hypothetical protein